MNAVSKAKISSQYGKACRTQPPLAPARASQTEFKGRRFKGRSANQFPTNGF